MVVIKTTSKKALTGFVPGSSPPVPIPRWWRDILRLRRMSEDMIDSYLARGRDIVFCGLHFRADDFERVPWAGGLKLALKVGTMPRGLLDSYDRARPTVARLNLREVALEREAEVQAIAAVAAVGGIAPAGTRAIPLAVDFAAVQQQQYEREAEIRDNELAALRYRQFLVWCY